MTCSHNSPKPFGDRWSLEMKIEFASHPGNTDAKTAIAVLVGESAPLTGAASALDATTGGSLKRGIEGGRFTGAKGQTLDLVAPANLDAGRVTLIGAGPSGEVSLEAMEAAGA